MMARRRDPPTALDYFPTPPWATRALFRHVMPAIGVDAIGSVWEPACGEGHMAVVFGEFVGSSVIASDIFDYGYGIAPVDFLNDPHLLRPEWIITNPPFSIACEFTLRALEVATEGVAMLVRTQWIEGIGRYENLSGIGHPRCMRHSWNGFRWSRVGGTRTQPPPQATLGLCGTKPQPP